MKTFDKNFLFSILIGYVVYLLVLFAFLYPERIILLPFLLSLIIVFLSGGLFKLLLKKHWKILYYSFLVPLGILFGFHISKFPGLGKAHWHDQTIMFAIIWGVLFAISYAVKFLIKKLKH